MEQLLAQLVMIVWPQYKEFYRDFDWSQCQGDAVGGGSFGGILGYTYDIPIFSHIYLAKTFMVAVSAKEHPYSI